MIQGAQSTVVFPLPWLPAQTCNPGWPSGRTGNPGTRGSVRTCVFQSLLCTSCHPLNPAKEGIFLPWFSENKTKVGKGRSVLHTYARSHMCSFCKWIYILWCFIFPTPHSWSTCPVGARSTVPVTYDTFREPHKMFLFYFKIRRKSKYNHSDCIQMNSFWILSTFRPMWSSIVFFMCVCMSVWGQGPIMTNVPPAHTRWNVALSSCQLCFPDLPCTTQRRRGSMCSMRRKRILETKIGAARNVLGQIDEE